MTLDEALAVWNKPGSHDWTAISVVLNAIASGDLIPLADHKQAVALMVHRALEICASMNRRGRDEYDVGWDRCADAIADGITAHINGDALAEVQALKARAAAARWNVTEDGNLVRLCRGEHPREEACTNHEEVFAPITEVQALQERSNQLTDVIFDRDCQLEDKLRAERDAAEWQRRTETVLLELGTVRGRAEAAEAEVARLREELERSKSLRDQYREALDAERAHSNPARAALQPKVKP